MTVAPDAFVREMERRWMAYPTRPGHTRIVTPEIRDLWSQLCEIFNGQLQHDGGPRPVVPSPLGAWKTTAMMVWSSMLPAATHPGVLTHGRNIGLPAATVRGLRDEAVRLAMTVDGALQADEVVDRALAKYDLTANQRQTFRRLWRQLEAGGT